MRESLIMKKVMLALASQGARIFRNNCGVLQNNQGGYVRYGLCPGSSDLIGFTHTGQFLAVEIKSAAGSLTEEQTHFIDTVNRFGGVAFMCRTVDEALNIYKERCGI